MIDLTGIRFGRLLVKEKSNIKKVGSILWICVCDCGNVKTINGSNLYSGRTKSCGCFGREVTKKTRTKHGQCRKTSEYNSWLSMKSRCNNKNSASYKYYGLRGITVCSDWKNSFNTFFRDMGPKPTNKHSIDRINYNGNYCKENCRWATKSEQVRNKRPCGMVPYKGVSIQFFKGKFHSYHARISINGKDKHIGFYHSAVQAAIAYDRELIRIKEIGTINFPLSRGEFG